jgi:hypothetical protein
MKQPATSRTTASANADCLQRLVRPHVGKSSNRLHPDADNPHEVAFAMEWTKAQEESHQLAWLLGNNFSDRDAEVAATVIQWLGSNVGMCFLEDVINREPKVKEWLAARIVWPNIRS